MMQNKSMMAGVVIVVLVLVAAGAYLFMQQNNTVPSTTVMVEETKPDSTTETEGMPAAPEGSAGAAMELKKPADAKAQNTATKSADAREVVVQASNFKFSTKDITVKKGEKIRILLKVTEGMHDFVVDGMDKVSTAVITENQEDFVEFTPTTTGTFEYYCSVGKHREMGMKGNLIVQ